MIGLPSGTRIWLAAGATDIGRRNYLFAGADSGGERAAGIYSLIGTAKLNGVDPEAWLRYVLSNIADYPVNQVDDFLPWNCAAKLVLPNRATASAR